MKIALICGSPKVSNSASGCLLSMVKEYLGAENYSEYQWNSKKSRQDDFYDILSSDVIVMAFPLYIDSIPAYLLGHLCDLDDYSKCNSIKSKAKVYVIINNGFFDARQSSHAMEVMQHWCKHIGLSFGQGLCVGGGGMLPSLTNIPNEKGPKKNIGEAIKILAMNIKDRSSADTKYVLPNIPYFAYKYMAQRGWRQGVKSNGLKGKDLGMRREFQLKKV